MQRLLTEYFGSKEGDRKRPSLSLSDLCLPLSCVRPRREGKMQVRVLPERTIRMVESMLERVNSDGATMTRLYAQFDEFVTLNGLPAVEAVDRAKSLWLFIIDGFEQGLKASSCRTYCSLLIEAHRRAGKMMHVPLIGDLQKALALLHCEEETNHAPDIPLDTCWKILHASTPVVRLTIWLLLAVGCRCADAENLKCGDLRLNPDASVSISYSITKNHRSKLHQYAIRIRPRELIPELAAIVRAPESAPMPYLSAADLNKALELEIPKMSLELSVTPTSYSFRRAFIQDIVARHRSEDGSIVDWLGAARFTGHNNTDVLRVAYTQKFENTL